MNDILLIAAGAGLKDGLNPCSFVSCAVFITLSLWLKKSIYQDRGSRLIFCFIYALASLSFSFGPMQFFVLQKYFIFLTKILYFALGIWAFVMGSTYFIQWFTMARNKIIEEKTAAVAKIFSFKSVLIYLGAIFLAIFLSALADFWPIDKYILVLGNETMLKNQWGIAGPLLISYTIVSMWPLWLVWATLSVKNIRPSMLRIVCAAIFFTASTSMILLFK